MLTELRKKGRIIFDSFYCKETEHKKEFGKRCTWFFDIDGLTKNSIVYSGGVGKDISFELEVVDTFGCNVFLIDPSETGMSTMGKIENHRPSNHFSPHLHFYSFYTAPSIYTGNELTLLRHIPGQLSLHLWPLRRILPGICKKIDAILGRWLPNLFSMQTIPVFEKKS
jgi:hypothetical protein